MASAILASRKVTYSAGLDLSQLQRDASQIQAILKSAFDKVKIDGSSLVDPTSIQQAARQYQSITQVQQEQVQLAKSLTLEERQKLVAAQAVSAEAQRQKADAQARLATARAELQHAKNRATAEKTAADQQKVTVALARQQADLAKAITAEEQRKLAAIKLSAETQRTATQNARANAAIQQQQATLAQAILQQERAATANASAEAQKRVSAVRGEQAERTQLARAQAAQTIEQEKRVTAQTKAEIRQREQEQRRARQQTAGGGLLGGAGGAIGGAIAGFLTLAAGRQLLQQAQDLAVLRKESLLASKAFEILSGGAGQAAARLAAIRQASGGTVTTMEALTSANQIAALKLAVTAEGFGRITKAARAVTFVSPIIHDIGGAISELALASANLSFRRLDQLGLTVDEVKSKMAELQDANSGLSDSQAFLQASVDTLISKYGAITDATEAQATGVNRLRVAWNDLQIAIATGGAGQFADAALGSLATGLNEIQTLVGTTNADVVRQTLDAMVEARQAAASAVSALPFLGEKAQQSVNGLKAVQQVFRNVNEGVRNGIPGAEIYQQQVSEIVTSVVRWGNVSDEQLGQLRAIQNEYFTAATAAKTFAAAQTDVGRQIDVATEEEIRDLRKQAEESLKQKALEIAPTVGLDKAREVLQQQLKEIDELFDTFKNKSAIDIALELSVGLPNLEKTLEDAKSNIEAILGGVEAVSVTSQISEAFRQLDSEAIDAVPGLATLREELFALEAEIAASGSATAEQVARISEINAVSNAAAASTSALAALQNEQGIALLNNNTHAAGLVAEISRLDAAQVRGAISAEEHAGALRILLTALIAVAQQGGATAGTIANLQGLLGGLPTFGAFGSPGSVRGEKIGQATEDRLAATEAARQRELARQAAERAAREQEQAAKRAGRELEQGAKRAADKIAGALQNVPGLFGTSEVTQEQLDAAKAGIPQNFADNFLRRLRDEIEHGVDWPDVSIGQAREALKRIGIDPAASDDAVLKQIEAAWRDSSLFADKANLALIDKGAVDASLELQQKMETGRQNIMDFFGVTIDEATGAVSAISTDTTAQDQLKQRVDDGKKKILDHLSESTDSAVAGATGGAGAGGATGGATGTGVLSVTVNPTIAEDAAQAIIDKISTQMSTKVAEQEELGAAIGQNIENGFVNRQIEGAPLAEAFLTAAGQQFGKKIDAFKVQGDAIAGLIDTGFISYWASVQSQTALADEVLATTGAQFGKKVNSFLSQGDTLGSIIQAGFTGYWESVQTQTTMADAMRLAFGTQVQATRDKVTGQGDALAGLIEQGFTAHWTTDQATGGGKAGMSDAFLTKLSGQFSTEDNIARYEGLGVGVAGFVSLGFMDFDFSEMATGAIGEIRDGFRTEENLTIMQSVGANIANNIAIGFQARAKTADWVGSVVDAIVAQVMGGVADGVEQGQ